MSVLGSSVSREVRATWGDTTTSEPPAAAISGRARCRASSQGGIPIRLDGRVIGAVGVSGDTPQVDEEIAIVGANALK